MFYTKHPKLLAASALCALLLSPLAHAKTTNTDPWAQWLGAANNAYVPQNHPNQANVADYNKLTLIPRYRIITQNRWRNTPTDQIIASFNALKTPPKHPIYRAFWQELAMGNFDGVSFSGNTKQQQTDLFAARLSTLINVGDAASAVRLYQTIETPNVPEKVARLGMEAMALTGQTEAACLEVQMVAQSLKSPEWLEDRAMCAVYEGDTTTARGLINTMVAQKTPVSAKFKAIMGQLAMGKLSRGVRAGDPALWQSIGVTLGAGLPNLATASGKTLAFLAQHPNVPLSTRTNAAERATANGYFDPDRLKYLYEQSQFSYSEADAAAVRAKVDTGQQVPGVQLYAAARKTFTGNARAKLVESAIKHMPSSTDPRALAWITLVDKLSLQPQNMPWFAPRAYGLLAMTGRQAVADLYETKTGAVVGRSTVGIMRGFTYPEKWTPAYLQQWQNQMQQKFGKAAAPRINTVLHILASHSVKPAQDILLQQVKAPSKILSNNRVNTLPNWQQAAQKGQRGLALAYALKALDNNSGSLLDSQQLEEMLKSFHANNLWVEHTKISLAIALENVL